MQAFVRFAQCCASNVLAVLHKKLRTTELLAKIAKENISNVTSSEQQYLCVASFFKTCIQSANKPECYVVVALLGTPTKELLYPALVNTQIFRIKPPRFLTPRLLKNA